MKKIIIVILIILGLLWLVVLFTNDRHSAIPFGTDPSLVGGDAAPGSPLDNVSISAVGTEPFWSFEYSEGRMVWSAPAMDELGNIVEVAHDMGFDREGDTYTLWGLGNDKDTRGVIHRETCSDGMSDRAYTHTVQVTHSGMQYNGCASVVLVK